ncbi:MAG TPA: Nif3-like dinuclear metal center hexameric protein [Bacteroidia bacterium]|nr:Nif3-like dinuclear metal center hexameric protein [Bacteroidia bacterium]
MEKLSTLINHLESIAPPALQESYDNAGLITGNPNMEITGALICLDSTEAVIDEAIQLGYNLVIAHHPIVFSGMKKFSGDSYVERVIVKAIRHDIALYAAHTNLDNVAAGVNQEICNRLGLNNISILAPKEGLLKKLVTYAPVAEAEKVRAALFAAGAGAIGNYDSCSFNIPGTGTFRGNEQSNPVKGQKGAVHAENEERIELIYEAFREPQILSALRQSHSYEEIAWQSVHVTNPLQTVGSGMVGNLPEPIDYQAFLTLVKDRFNTGIIRYTEPTGKPIQKVAVCGGSGSFLLKDAIKAGADAFVTADFKYHQFFDADGRIFLADIGHFESEQFTMDLFYRILNKKFPKFAVRLTATPTNPVRYF